MSEGEKMGRCRSEVDECRGSPSELKIAAAIDRLAADVAAVLVLAKVDQAPDDLGILRDAHGLSERCKELASRIVRQGIELRAEKLKAELEEQQSPAAPQPPAGWLSEEERQALIYFKHLLSSWSNGPNYAEVKGFYATLLKSLDAILARAGSPPARGWLTDEERGMLKSHAQGLREHLLCLRNAGTLGYSMDPSKLRREMEITEALLARAGLSPVVEVPKISERDIQVERLRVELDRYRTRRFPDEKPELIVKHVLRRGMEAWLWLPADQLVDGDLWCYQPPMSQPVCV